MPKGSWMTVATMFAIIQGCPWMLIGGGHLGVRIFRAVADSKEGLRKTAVGGVVLGVELPVRGDSRVMVSPGYAPFYLNRVKIAAYDHSSRYGDDTPEAAK